MTTFRLKKLSHPTQVTEELLKKIENELKEEKIPELKPVTFFRPTFHKKQLNPLKKVRFKDKLGRRHSI